MSERERNSLYLLATLSIGLILVSVGILTIAAQVGAEPQLERIAWSILLGWAFLLIPVCFAVADAFGQVAPSIHEKIGGSHWADPCYAVVNADGEYVYAHSGRKELAEEVSVDLDEKNPEDAPHSVRKQSFNDLPDSIRPNLSEAEQ